jgi:4-hydroxybutyryl-CoA dehydratase/vinylacetyl-CoA-Delta-isomerase
MYLAYTFATFHRFSAISYKIPCVEIMVGCALAMAKHNGREKAGHIRDKLADLAAYVETLRALTQAATVKPTMFGPIAAPNPLIANMAKLHFASGYHEFTAKIQDICGGILATAPDKLDWDNPETHSLLEHYLGGSDRYSSLDRMKMIHECIRQVCSHESAFHQVMSVHAEGSMAAQKMMILAEAPMQRYETLANAFAGITPWDSVGVTLPR